MSATSSQSSFLTTRRGKLMLVLLCTVAFVDFVDASIVNVALPSIRHALHISGRICSGLRCRSRRSPRCSSARRSPPRGSPAAPAAGCSSQPATERVPGAPSSSGGLRTMRWMWPSAALGFLRELEANNDSDWFRANRQRYDDYLLAPARALAEQLGELGEPRYFRPYNDLRFRPGPPLKEHVAFALGYGGAGGYYVQLSLDGLIIAAGLWRPASDQLERFRAAIDKDRIARAFEAAVAKAQAAGLSLAEPGLKRPPRGYRADHPRSERLRLKEITVRRHHPLGPWLHQPGCDARITSELRGARPLVDWLHQHVGPSRRNGSARARQRAIR